MIKTTALALSLLSSGALAHGHTHHHHYRVARHYRHGSASYAYAPAVESSTLVGSNSRPRAWCGWYMRQLKGGGPEYNLAWNWSRRGTPTGPHVGAVVVWPHHVGLITGQEGGRWVVKSGNDGHAVRERARSVAGAVFRDI